VAYNDLAIAIKGIVKDYIDNENISDLVYATYTGAGLKIDNKPLPVDMDMVDVPMNLQTVSATINANLTSGFEVVAKDENNRPVTVESIKLTNVPVTITMGLVAGDRVAVVQKKGAQKYAIIGRV